MAVITTSLSSIPQSDFGYDQARHLLARAGFGGTPRQIVAIQSMGLKDAVNYLVDYEGVPDSSLAQPELDRELLNRPLTPEGVSRRNLSQEERDRIRALFLQRRAEDRRQMASLERWWLGRIIETPRPLEEKLVLLWHSHFASNHRTVQNSTHLLQQNEMFRSQAKNFAGLVRGIVRDPAMLKFLNNDRNNRSRPNENLAREIMELFTLGEGHYSEYDIKQGARALTGFTYSGNEFRFRENNHDPGEKKILGKTARFDGDGFANLLLSKFQTARFAAFKAYRHFVADFADPPEKREAPAAHSVINQLAKQIASDKGDLGPMLKKLFMSRHFYDPRIVGNKIKSPIELVSSTARHCGAPVRDLSVLASAAEQMGQKLFDPPSVAGWEVGRAWINASTLYTRQNLAVYQVTGKLPYQDSWNRDALGYDPLDLVRDLDPLTPESAVDYLMATFLAGGGNSASESPVYPARRAELLAFLNRKPGPPTQTVTADRVLGLLLLITAMPEYQLC